MTRFLEPFGFRFAIRDRAAQFTEASYSVLVGAGIEVVKIPVGAVPPVLVTGSAKAPASLTCQAIKYRLAGVEHGTHSGNRLVESEFQQVIGCLLCVLSGSGHPGRDEPGDDGHGE